MPRRRLSAAAREDAAAEEAPFERSISVHAAAAEAGRFAGCIQTREDLASAGKDPAREVGFESAQRLAREDIQLHCDQRAGLGVQDPVQRGGPDQLVAQIIPRLADGGDLQVFAERVVEL